MILGTHLRSWEGKLSSFIITSVLLILLVLVGCSPGDGARPGEEIAIFHADRGEISAGECTFLRWEVFTGFGATLNGQVVAMAGEMEVCPDEPMMYELRVDMGDRIEVFTVEIRVGGESHDEPPGEGYESGDQPAFGPDDIEYETYELVAAQPAYVADAWVATGGPPGGLGYDIRMDPRNPDVMYVTDAYGGVFKSYDGGETWTPANNGITALSGPAGDAYPVFSLTIDPNNPDTIWIGTQFGGGVFRSDDSAESWRPMSNGIIERSISVRGFTVEPGNSDVVYLAGEISSWEWNGEGITSFGLDMTMGSVYKTTNGGQDWVRIWHGDNLARYIWIHPDNHDLLYVSTGIFDREAANADAATMDPGGVGILRSRDGGASWEVLGADNGIREDELYFGSLYMNPENAEVLIAAAGNDPYLTAAGGQIGGIYLTVDGGDTWERTLGLNNASVVEICAGDPNVAYAASRTGFYRSLDSGRTWTEMAGDLWGSDDVLAGFPIDLQCDPRDAQRIFVNNYIGGNLLSIDGGATWELASKGYTGALMSEVDVFAGDPSIVFAAERMGVFASNDGGANWRGTAHGVARSPEAWIVAVDPYNRDHVIAVITDAGLIPFMSIDGGVNWARMNADVIGNSDHPIASLRFSPHEPGLLLAAPGEARCWAAECYMGPGAGVLKSVDGGFTWTQTLSTAGQVVDMRFSESQPGTVYAIVYPNELYRSLDHGDTWQQIAQDATSMPEVIDPDMRAIRATLAIDPGNPERLYLGFYYGGILASDDGGRTWETASVGLNPGTSVTDFEVDPLHGLIYASTWDSGVYYSMDGGNTWRAINRGLTNQAVINIGLSGDGGVLYAATTGGGVFRLGEVDVNR